MVSSVGGLPTIIGNASSNSLPNSLECLDANHSFPSRLGLQNAVYSSFPCAGTIGTYNRPTYLQYIPYLRMFHHKAGLSSMYLIHISLTYLPRYCTW